MKVCKIFNKMNSRNAIIMSKSFKFQLLLIFQLHAFIHLFFMVLKTELFFIGVLMTERMSGKMQDYRLIFLGRKTYDSVEHMAR